MNYPNKIKKNYSKTINYANRGTTLENIITEANKYYLENNIAVIYKKATPIGINKTNYKEITSAYFKEKSTLDFVGIYKGYYIEFDAKETKSSTSFPLSNIHNHQIVHIKNILEHKGFAFLIIQINNSYYLLSGNLLINFINENSRKSIPYEYIKENCLEIKYNYIKGLDYIVSLNKLLEV